MATETSLAAGLSDIDFTAVWATVDPGGGNGLTLVFVVLIFLFAVWVAGNESSHPWLAWKIRRRTRALNDGGGLATRGDLKDEAALIGKHSPALGHAVKELVESTFSRRERLYNSIQLAEFVDVEEVLEENSKLLSPSLAAAAPGLLTAFGILGTFVGLVLGLEGLGNSVDGDSVEGLIEGLHVAFRTSIWGLMSSMFVTVWHRYAVGSLSSAVAGYVRAVDSRLARGTPEPILTSIDQLVSESKAQLVKLNTDLAPRLEAALAEPLKQMVKVQTEMATGMQDFVSGAGDKQLASIASVIEQVTKGLERELGQQLKEAGESLRAFVKEQAVQTAETRALLAQLAPLAQTLVDASQRQADAFGYVERSADALGLAAGHVTEAAGEAAIVIQGVQEPLAAAREAVEQSSRLVESQGRLVSGLTEQAKELADTARAQHTSWGTYVAEMESITTALTEGLTEFTGAFQPQIESVMSEFDRELAKAVARLGTTVGQMRDHTEDFDDRIQGVLGALDVQVQALGRSVPKLQGELATAVAETRTLVAAAAARGRAETETSGP